MNFEQLFNFVFDYIVNNFSNIFLISFFVTCSLIFWLFANLFKKGLYFLLSFFIFFGIILNNSFSLLYFFLEFNLLLIFFYEQIILIIKKIYFELNNTKLLQIINFFCFAFYLSLIGIELKFWFKFMFILNFLKEFNFYLFLYFLCAFLSFFIFLIILLPLLSTYSKYNNVISLIFLNMLYYLPIFAINIVLIYFEFVKFVAYKMLLSLLFFVSFRIFAIKFVEFLIEKKKYLNNPSLLLILDYVLLMFNFGFVKFIDIIIVFFSFLIIENNLVFLIKNIYFIKIFQIVAIVFVYRILNNLINYLTANYLERYSSNLEKSHYDFSSKYLSKNIDIKSSFDVRSTTFDNKRFETIANIVRIVLQILLVLFVFQFILQNFFGTTISVGNFTLAASAIAFGLQTYVRDFFGGFLNIIEGTLNIGDKIQINGIVGEIEVISIRTIQMRSFDGALHIVPFNQINSIAHYSKKYAKLIISVIVKNSTKSDDMRKALVQTNQQFFDTAHKMNVHNITELEIIGLTEFVLGGLKFEVAMRLPLGVKRIRYLRAAYNKHLKDNLDEYGIELVEFHSRYNGNSSVVTYYS